MINHPHILWGPNSTAKKEWRNTRNLTNTVVYYRFSDISGESISESMLSPGRSVYQDLRAYNNSKLCNVLFSLHLNKLLSDKGVFSNSLHPGNVMSTSLSRHWWLYRVIYLLARPFTKSLVNNIYGGYIFAWHMYFVMSKVK